MKRHGALAVDVPLLCDFLHVRDLSGNSPNKILEQVLATLDHEEQGMNPSTSSLLVQVPRICTTRCTPRKRQGHSKKHPNITALSRANLEVAWVCLRGSNTVMLGY